MVPRNSHASSDTIGGTEDVVFFVVVDVILEVRSEEREGEGDESFREWLGVNQ